jgi:hypothetical protein
MYFFFETYQQFIKDDLALFFLNSVNSDLKSLPDNAIITQKSIIDKMFYEKLKNVKTVDDIDTIFKNYVSFFLTYQKFITEDFATLFYKNIPSDIKSISESEIRELKVEIDKKFFQKVRYSRTIDELCKLFENYLAFFDIYQGIIAN